MYVESGDIRVLCTVYYFLQMSNSYALNSQQKVELWAALIGMDQSVGFNSQANSIALWGQYTSMICDLIRAMYYID